MLLATRNEFDTVPLVLEEIAEAATGLARLGWTLDVVIVDDSDDDRLHAEAGALSTRLGVPIEILRGRRMGLGAAIVQGFEACLADPGVEFVVNLDADGQHDARQMGDLLRIFDVTEAAVTIGSRWTKGGRCYGLTALRRVVSRASSLALRMSGVPWQVKDPTTSFRVYRRDIVDILRREVRGFNGFSFFGAGIAVANAHGRLVNETPIHFRPRVGGNSNLSLGQTLRAVRDLPRIRAHWSMVRRREKAFTMVRSDPQKYTASRELEQLSNTPVSTEIILDELMPHIGRRVLEVGAGLGLITEQLLAHGRSVTALEPDPGLFERISSKSFARPVELMNSTLPAAIADGWSPEPFDTALYVNVLEHIGDDVEELRCVRELLAPGGSVVVFVPATPSLYGTMDWMSAHFRRYRQAELETVARAAGFDVVDCRYFDLVGKFPYWLMYRVMRRTNLGGGAVGIYDKVIIPLSARIPGSVMRRTGGKNLILVGRRDRERAPTATGLG